MYQDWFYGFKMNVCSKFGVFPKACVAFKRDDLSDAVSAELRMMVEKLISMFVVSQLYLIFSSVRKIWQDE